jgi:hypothetical protein
MSVTVFLRPGPPIGAPKPHGHRVPWCCLAQLPRTCAYVKGRPGVVGSRPAVRSHVRCRHCPSAPRCHVLPSLIIGPTVGHCHLPTLPKPSSLAVIAAPPLSTEAIIHCLLRTGAPRHCLIASPPPLCDSRCREQAVGASRAPPRRRLHRRSVLQAEFRVRVLPRWSCRCRAEAPSPEPPPHSASQCRRCKPTLSRRRRAHIGGTRQRSWPGVCQPRFGLPSVPARVASGRAVLCRWAAAAEIAPLALFFLSLFKSKKT